VIIVINTVVNRLLVESGQRRQRRMEDRIQSMVQRLLLPLEAGATVRSIPAARAYAVEQSLQEILRHWPFSADLVTQVVRDLSGQIWITVQAYTMVGKRYRPILVCAFTEETARLSREDLIALIGALVEEIEDELESLRQEGVALASGAELEAFWSRSHLDCSQ
jgi:hypothetical protein